MTEKNRKMIILRMAIFIAEFMSSQMCCVTQVYQVDSLAPLRIHLVECGQGRMQRSYIRDFNGLFVLICLPFNPSRDRFQCLFKHPVICLEVAISKALCHECLRPSRPCTFLMHVGLFLDICPWKAVVQAAMMRYPSFRGICRFKPCH